MLQTKETIMPPVEMEAIVEHGLLRPVEPLSIPEGTRVSLTVRTPQAPRSLAEQLRRIAALPDEGPDDGFSGEDHDKVLYGPEGAR